MSQDFWVPTIDVTEPLAWLLCSEMVRHRPEARIYLWHPGGGQYDMLSVFLPEQGWDNRPLDFNMAGSIHYPVRGEDHLLPWKEFFQQGPTRILELIETSSAWRQTEKTPPSTPAVLAYRVIAGVLRMTAHTKDRVKVDMAFSDPSESGSADTAYLYPGFEHALEHAKSQPSSGVPYEPFSRLWSIANKSKVLAYIHDSGHVFLPGGRVVDLASQYRAHGSNINRVIALELLDVVSSGGN